MADAVSAIRKMQPGVVHAYSDTELARLIEREQRDEEAKAQAELSKLLPLEENPVRQQELAEYEVRRWQSFEPMRSAPMMAKPRWIIPRKKIVKDEMPEPLKPLVIDRITGEQFMFVSSTDNGVIVTRDGSDEYFMPVDSYELRLT